MTHENNISEMIERIFSEYGLEIPTDQSKAYAKYISVLNPDKRKPIIEEIAKKAFVSYMEQGMTGDMSQRSIDNGGKFYLFSKKWNGFLYFANLDTLPMHEAPKKFSADVEKAFTFTLSEAKEMRSILKSQKNESILLPIINQEN